MTQIPFNVLPNLMVINPREKVPEGFTVINTTSRDATNIGKQLSPFFLSNILLYEGIVAKNMENAWQFSKVYQEFADEKGNPSQAYFNWAKKGWSDSFAHRYANGKGNVPLYSYWKTQDKLTGQWIEHHWDYITARKNIYFPLYAKAIIQTPAFKELYHRIQTGEKIALWDFDGYDHAAKSMTYEQVVNEPKYKCGHAFVLYGLLTNQLKVIDDELIYDFDLTMENTFTMDNTKKTSKKEYTFFFHLTSAFSNFHPSCFEYKGFTFISNEQFMMFSKAKTFGDENTAQKILKLNDEPLIKDFIQGVITREQIINDKALSEQWNKLMMRVKALGREVSNYDDKIWVQKRPKVVLFGAREKFKQNKDLKTILMNTGESLMVEASPYDKIWGIGLSTAQAKVTPPEKWPGLNLLGHVLDELKIEFSQEKTLNNENPSNIEVLNFYHLNKTIPEDGVYIGRFNHNFNLSASIFANPFPVRKPEDRGSSIESYRQWLWQQVMERKITKKDLLALNNKKLVCYCKPKACHGDVVQALVNYIINNEAEFDQKLANYEQKTKSKLKI